MKSIAGLFLLLLLFVSCSREKAPYIGPSYISAPEGFDVSSFTVSASSCDFSVNNLYFDATFTHDASWILTIRGKKSGAVYTKTGTSIGFSNLEWTGRHDPVYFFRTGETIEATLSFYGTSLTKSVTSSIIKAQDFRTCGQFPLYGDFELPNLIKAPNWAKFNVAQQGADTMAIDYKGNVVPSVQGKYYYYIKGLGNQQVFVDGIQFTGSMSPAVSSDANDVWVNLHLYGTGDPNALVNIEYQESDFDGTSVGYNGEDDDAFVAEVTLDHVGWKLFSFKYSSLKASPNALFGGSGNKLHEPDRLKSFDVILLKKSNPNSPVEVYFDYPIITVGGPFVPCK